MWATPYGLLSCRGENKGNQNQEILDQVRLLQAQISELEAQEKELDKQKILLQENKEFMNHGSGTSKYPCVVGEGLSKKMLESRVEMWLEEVASQYQCGKNAGAGVKFNPPTLTSPTLLRLQQFSKIKNYIIWQCRSAVIAISHFHWFLCKKQRWLTFSLYSDAAVFQEEAIDRYCQQLYMVIFVLFGTIDSVISLSKQKSQLDPLNRKQNVLKSGL